MTDNVKTLDITETKGARANIADIKVWGDGDSWKLLCKASSEAEGWMKSTKAYEIEGVGCMVQVTTQQNGQVAEAVTFVPFTTIVETTNQLGEVVGRHLEIASRHLEGIPLE